MRIGEIMQKNIVLCREGETAGEAIARMREHKVRCLPVVDEEDRLRGAVWTCSILSHLLPPYAASEELESLRFAPDLGILHQNYLKLADQPVMAIADPDPLTVAPDDSLLAAAAAIVHRDAHPEYVFVISPHRRLLGLVSASDILEWLLRHPHGGEA